MEVYKAAIDATEVEAEMLDSELNLTRMEPFRVSSRCVEEPNPESPHDAMEDDEDEEVDEKAELEKPINM